jgi:3-hydroxybutyryl-CoA dehydrogenase
MAAPELSGTWPSRVAVVGAGTMGIGISHVFALSGIPTTLVDVTADRAEQAVARSRELVATLEQSGIVGQGAARRVEELTSAAGSVDAGVAEADLVVEAVVERADVKHDVYAAIEAAAAASAVIATNTSSIPIELLASRLAAPERFLGVHWFVPPLLVPCVEVIPSRSTDERVVAQVVDVLTRLGKAAVVVGDGPGFVANRIQFAMFKEAARIVEEGLATAEQVDEVVRSSFGFRLPFFGPFTIADMAGLDVYSDIFETLERGLGPDFSAPGLLTAHVENGDFGVKTGHGFLDIGEDEAADLIARRDRAYLALSSLRRELLG